MTLNYEYNNQDKFMRIFSDTGFECSFDSEDISKYAVNMMLIAISQNEELADLIYPRYYIGLKTNHIETNAFFEINSDTNSINFIFIIDGDDTDFQTSMTNSFAWNEENRTKLINLLREMIDDCYDDTIEEEEVVGDQEEEVVGDQEEQDSDQ
jgi:hypothetical protein